MKGIYAAKNWFSAVLSPITKAAIKFHLSPNLFTLIGVLGGVLAGIGIFELQAWLVLTGVIVRLAGANLDGAVARARNLQSKRGFWINELGDRLADTALFAGFFVLANNSAGTWVTTFQLIAMALAVVPTAVSLWGHFHGVTRINGGPFGKSERAFGAVLVVLVIQLGSPLVQTLETWAVLVVFGSLLTAEVRSRRIGRELSGL